MIQRVHILVTQVHFGMLYRFLHRRDSIPESGLARFLVRLNTINHVRAKLLATLAGGRPHATQFFVGRDVLSIGVRGFERHEYALFVIKIRGVSSATPSMFAEMWLGPSDERDPRWQDVHTMAVVSYRHIRELSSILHSMVLLQELDAPEDSEMHDVHY